MTVPKVTTKQIKGSRWYIIDKDDPTKTVPGVSSITSMMPKDALTPAAVKETAAFVCRNQDAIRSMSKVDAFDWIKGAYRRSWNAKANLGTRVHAGCEQIDKALIEGRKPAFRVETEIKPYLNQYAKFIREFEVEPVMSEVTVFNGDVGYAGTFDGLKWMTLPTGERALFDVDTKSGASGVWPEAALQQTAYNHAPYYIDPKTGLLVPMPAELRQDIAFALWLRPEGYAVLPLDTGVENWQHFKRLRACFQWEKVEQHGEVAVRAPINERPIRRGYRPPELS